jgi:hypothetical protein
MDVLPFVASSLRRAPVKAADRFLLSGQVWGKVNDCPVHDSQACLARKGVRDERSRDALFP